MRKDTGTTRTTLESFMKKVYPEPNTGCWLWGGKVNENGYGRTWTKHLKLHNAHRLSYYLHNGDFDRSMHVLHKCDVPSCVNPDHLYLGDQAQNVKDRDSRNRGVWKHGSMNHRATISEETVRQIKIELQRGENHRLIAENHKTKKHIVSDISSGRCWRSVTI